MLSTVSVLELISSLRVFALQEVFEMLETNQSLCHVAFQRAEL